MTKNINIIIDKDQLAEYLSFNSKNNNKIEDIEWINFVNNDNFLALSHIFSTKSPIQVKSLKNCLTLILKVNIQRLSDIRK